MLGDLAVVGQPGHRTDPGERDLARVEHLPRDLLHPVGRDAVDAIDRLLQRDRAAPEDLLARQLTGFYRACGFIPTAAGLIKLA